LGIDGPVGGWHDVSTTETGGRAMQTIPTVNIWNDRWECECGAGGAESDPLDNWRAAVKHQDTVHGGQLVKH